MVLRPKGLRHGRIEKFFTRGNHRVSSVTAKLPATPVNIVPTIQIAMARIKTRCFGREGAEFYSVRDTAYF